jgi:hypothetical protein
LFVFVQFTHALLLLSHSDPTYPPPVCFTSHLLINGSFNHSTPKYSIL